MTRDSLRQKLKPYQDISRSQQQPMIKPSRSSSPSKTKSRMLLNPVLVSTLVAAYYISTSTILTVVNRFIFASSNLSLSPQLLLFAQSNFTLIAFLLAYVHYRLFQNPKHNNNGYLNLSNNEAQTEVNPTEFLSVRSDLSKLHLFTSFSPLSLLYLTMVLAGSIGLKFTSSVVMYNTLRRTSTLFVLILDVLYSRWEYQAAISSSSSSSSSIAQQMAPSYPSSRIVFSVLLMTVAALLAGVVDPSFNVQGYLAVFIANLSGALYLVWIKKTQRFLQMDSFSILFFNTAITWLPILLMCLAAGDLNDFTRIVLHHKREDPLNPDSFLSIPAADVHRMLKLFALTASMGVLINHSIFLNTTKNSPLTQSVSAQIKDYALAILSYIWIDAAILHEKNAWDFGKKNVGIVLGFVASALYAHTKYVERAPSA